MQSRKICATASKQSGMVLFIALIVLVSMTLAAIGMTRSIDTSNLAAGNMAMKQSALNASDEAVEQAVTWLESQAGTGSLQNDNTGSGYFSAAPAQEPVWTSSGAWVSSVCANSCVGDSGGNVTRFVVHRMCAQPNMAAGGANECAWSGSSSSNGSSNDVASATGRFKGNGSIFYRVTARVDGPRNTQSYTQVMVAMGPN
jgi:type IV pilus assembly protein PilX